MIYHNRYLHVGNHRLELGGELTDKGGIVVDGKVGNDIYGEQTVWLGIEETMHLHNLLVGSEGLYDFRLQFGAAVLSRGNGIDANGHDDAVLVEHVGGNLAVGWALREFGADDGDDARERVAEVIDGIHHDGHRTGKYAYDCLETSQQHVSHNAYPAGPNDFLTSIHVD